MMTFNVIKPETEQQWQQYYQLRYKQLRQPWQQPQGSEKDDLEQQAVHRMLLDQEGNVIAVGRFHKTASDVAQIRFMAVDDNYQGQGAGRLLLIALEHEASLQGVTRIELHAREVALAFYQACDYQLQGKSHVLYDTIVHYHMVKVLDKYSNEFSGQLADLEQIWHQTIPVSAHMKIQPVSLYQQQLTVCAYRDANINLHNTMFAGSIYTLATLTGWGHVHLLLQQNDLQADIVLADANIRYHKPLHGQPLARTVSIEGDVSNLMKKGRARLQLLVNVLDGDLPVASFTGKYVAMAKKEAG